MIIIGLDPHPATHTAAALDAATGRVLATSRFPNTEEGNEDLRLWALEFPERHWAVEGAGNPFVAALVAELLAGQERLTNIPPNLTSQYRKRRSYKKNDEVDAINAAKALLANFEELPAYAPHPEGRRLQVLTRTRARLAQELKANRMAYKDLASEGSEEERLILADLVAFLSEQIRRLERLLGELLKRIRPELLLVGGVGVVLGATIVAEVGTIERFEKESGFASYCGAAPVERSSGKSGGRVCVNPQGNRRMNYVLHMIAQVRLRTDGGRSKALVERKQGEGKTKRAALRVLKTYIARELYRTLRAIEKGRELAPVAA